MRERRRLGGRIGQRAVINSGIQIERRHGSIRDGNARQSIIDSVASHARFEVHEVAGLGVRNVSMDKPLRKALEIARGARSQRDLLRKAAAEASQPDSAGAEAGGK